MFLTTKTEYHKKYLPKYTGHVPNKQNLFGITTGKANEILITTNGSKKFEAQGVRHPGSCSNVGARNYSAGANLRTDKLKYTNWSKKAWNWIWGPNDQIRYQQIPGYTGHVPGIKSENLFSKSYARTTATANSNKRFNRNLGQTPAAKDRFKSHNQKEFSPVNFRRYLENPGIIVKKDYQDYANSINHEKFNQKNKILTSSTPKTINTICSNTGTNFFNRTGPMRSHKHSAAPSQDFDVKGTTIKPQLLENQVFNKKEFFSLSDGFQRVFANDKKDTNLVIPISGYKGHKRGDKSQNFFGRSFRDCAIQSRKLERSLQRKGKK